MKKITLLIALIVYSLGFSQVPKIDFETNGAASIVGVNLSSATVGSGTGTNTTMVANLSKGAGQYDNPFEIILKNQISFATTGVKTITFDFYQATAIARPILVKVEAGTGDTFAANGYEVQVNTAATAGWQTLSFNFASCRESYPQTGTNKNIVGSYKKMYIFIDFGLAPASTAAIDNITGGTQGAPIVVVADPAPTTAAPTPPARNAVDVISLFSNAYTNIPIDNWSASYDDSSISDVVIAGNDTKKINFTNFLGVQFTGAGKRIDLTPMTHMHIDIWTATPTLDKTFGPKLSNWANGSGEANAILFTATNASTPPLPNPNPGTWIPLDIPLSSFTAGARNDIAELILTSAGPGSLGLVYMDNVYFWRAPLAAGTPTISFTIPAKSVSDAAFSLTPLITSNSPGAITYSSSNTAVATVSGSTVTIVGVGSTTITANQAAGGAYNAASKTAVLDVNPLAAPAPQVSAASVIGLYGETYPVTGYVQDFGSVITVDLDTSTGTNNALKYNFANGGYGQEFGKKDISAMQFVHFDYYTTNATAFRLYMISNSTTVYEAIYDIPNITTNQWVGVNIPMSAFTNFPAFKATDFFQFKFDVAAATPGTVYIDNLYLSLTNPLSTESFQAASVKMYPNPAKNTLNIDANSNIQKVSVYNILGQEVLSKKPNSNSTTLQTSGLQRGTYIVKSTIDGKTTTSKLIKE